MAPIGDPTNDLKGGSRKGPIFLFKSSSRDSSLATGFVFDVADK
jgi:hypothetical protein